MAPAVQGRRIRRAKIEMSVRYITWSPPVRRGSSAGKAVGWCGKCLAGPLGIMGTEGGWSTVD